MIIIGGDTSCVKTCNEFQYNSYKGHGLRTSQLKLWKEFCIEFICGPLFRNIKSSNLPNIGKAKILLKIFLGMGELVQN